MPSKNANSNKNKKERTAEQEPHLMTHMTISCVSPVVFPQIEVASPPATMNGIELPISPQKQQTEVTQPEIITQTPLVNVSGVGSAPMAPMKITKTIKKKDPSEYSLEPRRLKF